MQSSKNHLNEKQYLTQTQPKIHFHTSITIQKPEFFFMGEVLNMD